MDSYFDGYLTESFTDNYSMDYRDNSYSDSTKRMTDIEVDAYYDDYMERNQQFEKELLSHELMAPYPNIDGIEEYPDLVNSPHHYTHNGIEAIDVIDAKLTNDQYQGYLQGSVMKYLLRSNYKGKREEDLKKAQWYLNRLVDTV